jgi:two-component system, OmpR family, heavy metal sensor histidine kinase CusS
MTLYNKFKSYIKTTRFKTTLWYSAVFLFLEIVIGFILYIYLNNSLHRQLDLSLSKQAEMIYNFVKESKVDLSDFKPDSVYTSPDQLVYDLIFEAVALNPRNTYIEVAYKNKMIFQSDNLMGHEIKFPETEGESTKLIDFTNKRLSPYLIRAAFIKRDDYKIVVAFPIDLVDTTLNSLINLYIIIAPLFLILSILGGHFISARSLSRIGFIIKETDKITTQNLDEKIAGGEFDDEYGRLVRTMNDMIQRIKTSIEYMNQFSISASHELKTPLTILRGEIEIALKGENTPEEYKTILRSNYEETLRLINIVDKLFLISKIDHSLIKLNKTEVDLKDYLTNLTNQMKFLCKKNSSPLMLETNCNEKINIDVMLMKQVFSNLIENATKYGKKHEPVRVRCENLNQKEIKISVINKGDGIPEDNLTKIFDRFYRIENSRNRTTGGTGLGLSIVKSIISLHDGEVGVTSDPGGETIFSVILPKAS